MNRTVLALSCAALLCGAAASAASPAGRMVVPLLDEGPTVDGSLGGAFWGQSASTGLFVRPGTDQRSDPPVMARVAAAGRAVYFGFAGAGSPDSHVYSIRLWPRAAFGAAPKADAEPEGEDEPNRDGQAPPEDEGQDAPRPPDAADDEAKPAPAPLGPLGPEIVVRVGGGGGVQVEGEGAAAKAGVMARPGGYALEVGVELPEGCRPRPGDMWLAAVERVAGGRGAWLLPPDEARVAPAEEPARGTPTAQLFFGRSNLLDNGGFENWQRGLPADWTLEGPEGARAVAFPERRRVFEGGTACRLMYRESVQMRHARRVALRKGAHYELRLAIWALPDPGDAPEAELSASPHKTRTFNPPQGWAVVAMPFQAKEDYAEVALTLRGRSGALVVDAFRLEMALPEAPPPP